ncbi:MAG: D-aminoacyl-tRNA deacylase [Candidatus Thermoplasmatota archaeon]
MILIVISAQDEASLNIKDKILKLRAWNKENNLYSHDELVLCTIKDYHLYHNDIDLEISQKIGKNIDSVIFASKHRSETKLATLTIHSIGNFGRAELGGKDRELVPTSPNLMTRALRILAKRAKDENLGYEVSFEVTHHGPYLATPSFFIEIGSDESAWKDDKAGEVIANAIFEAIELKAQYPVAIGIGGGHYAPRFTELALTKKIDFAHLVPSYQIENLDEEIIDKIIKISNAKLVYFHRKALQKEIYRKLEKIFSERGLKVVREKDLEDL